MLDVVVSVYKDGVLVNKNGKSSAGKAGGSTAALGVGALGKMQLGKG